jgi:hypothetical protein
MLFLLRLLFFLIVSIVVHFHLPIAPIDLVPQLSTVLVNSTHRVRAENRRLLPRNSDSTPPGEEDELIWVGVVLEDLKNVELVVIGLNIGLVESC